MATIAIQQKIQCDHSFIIEGRVSSSTPNSLSDSKKNWPLNLLLGKRLKIWYGTGEGQVVSVVSNTHNQLFINANWSIQPDQTSLYRIRVSSTQNYCPKCNGSNEYRDISFIGGKRKTLTGIQKLAQTVDTILLSPLGASIFDPDFGSGIELALNADIDNDDELTMYIQNNVISALNVLQNKQGEAIPYLSFDNSELFGQLVNVSVERRESDPRILDLTAEVNSASIEQVIVTAPLNTR